MPMEGLILSIPLLTNLENNQLPGFDLSTGLSIKS